MPLPPTVNDASEDITAERQITGAALYTHGDATTARATCSVRATGLTAFATYSFRFKRGAVYGPTFIETADASGNLSFDSDPIILANGDALSLYCTGQAGDTATSWTIVLIDDGTYLDAVSITAPTGPATTFRGMIVQTWRRFFKKSALSVSNGNLITYADDGTTAITTQTVTNTGGTKTHSEAS